MLDHHTVFRATSPRVRVGDVVVPGISHPRSAFSRWRAMPLLDDEGSVTGVWHRYV